MDKFEKERLIERLSAKYGALNRDQRDSGSACGERSVQAAMSALANAGAARFGVRTDQPADLGFSACSLAPPLARMIDHTALKAETSEDQVRALCLEARQYCFASVCISPCYVDLAAHLLRDSEVAVCTVLGFPLGATHSFVKSAEAERAILDGASELDMVANIGFVKSRRFDDVEEDIRGVVRAARSVGLGRTVLVKVILETALLTDEEKVIACVLAKNAGADFVKTSTGFSTGGATASDIALMRRVVGPDMGVKASGGVRSREDAETMIAHGATRIGASASVAIIQNLSGPAGNRTAVDGY